MDLVEIKDFPNYSFDKNNNKAYSHNRNRYLTPYLNKGYYVIRLHNWVLTADSLTDAEAVSWERLVNLRDNVVSPKSTKALSWTGRLILTNLLESGLYSFNSALKITCSASAGVASEALVEYFTWSGFIML